MTRTQAERLWHEWRNNHHEALCWSEDYADSVCAAWIVGRSDLGPRLMPGQTIEQ